MSKVRISQTTFTAGRLPDLIDARDDKEIYKAGGSVVTNWLPTPQGPLISRYGFEYVATLTDERERAITFKFDGADEQYVFVLGNNQLKVFYDKVLKATITTSVPWAYNDLAKLKYVNKEDALLVVSPVNDIKLIERTGSHTSWQTADFVFDHKPFYRFPDTKRDSSNNTITLDADTNTVSGIVTSSTALFTSDWDQKEIRFGNTRGYGIIKINDGTLTTTASTTAAYTVIKNITGTGADAGWDEQAFSAHRGYFSAVTFHNDRLYFAGTSSLPQTIFASAVGDYFNFDDTDTLDDMAFARTLNTGLIEKIKDLKSYDNLMVFTDVGEHEIHANGAVITPKAIQASKRTEYGIGDVGVIEIDSELIYLTNNSKELRALVFAQDTQAFVGKNYTLVHNDAVDGSVDIAYLRNYRKKQSNHIFVVNGDGDIAVCGLTASKDITGWTDITTPSGLFKTVTVAKTDHGNGIKIDTLYTTVKRGTDIYLEALTESEVLLDHFISDTAASTTSWGPYATLLSDTVQVVKGVFGSPTVHGEVTVDGSGNITLNSAATDIQVGFEYVRIFTSLPISLIANSQNFRGKRIRLVNCEVNVLDTKSITIESKLVSTRKFGSNLLDQPLPNFSGTLKKNLGGWGRDKTITISVDEPVDATLRGFTVEIGVAFG